MSDEEKHNYKQALQIFDHHINMGTFMEVSGEVFQELHTQTTRDIIIKILSKGMEDIHPKTLEPLRRYALSGAEILEKVNEYIASPECTCESLESVTKSNLFFHLRKLEEGGFVTEAGVIKSGRRNTTYYGKSHKVFITMESGSHKVFGLLKDPLFKQFLMDINPEITAEQIDTILSELDILNAGVSDYFMQWLQENSGPLQTYMFSFPDLFTIFGFIQRFRPETTTALQSLSDMLHIDQEKLIPKDK
ncbi:MAG: hypothetical protein ACXAE3_17640 [Candidatus Kariarchaeaceae archaeon]